MAHILGRFCRDHGIRVMRYDAYSTNSVYLKLDYGLLYSIRISDHRGKDHLSYRFNAIKYYHGPKFKATRYGWNREFYTLNPDELNNLCRRILELQMQKRSELGPYKYQREMEYRKQTNAGKKGFWSTAQDLV